MTADRENPPICDHCGEPKDWKKDSRRPSGGTWRCMKRRRETEKAYNQTPEGKARRIAGDKKYRASAIGKEKRRLQQQRYVRGETGRKTRKEYEATPKYYVAKRKYLLKKMREQVINKLKELENGR